MFLKLLGKAAAVKSGVEGFFTALNFLLNAKDRIDDDLDGDGKSQLQNILEKIQEIESEVVAFVKDAAGDIQEVVRLILELQAHVLSDKKKE